VFFKLLTLLTLPIALASYLFSVLSNRVLIFQKQKEYERVEHWSQAVQNDIDIFT